MGTTANKTELMIDCFSDDRPAGQVIGTQFDEGMTRKGVDREGVLGIDHGALRIQPLVKCGWGRAGIAYGPFQRRNGLTFGAFLTNCHNTSQGEPLPDGFRPRLVRWALGSETEKPLERMRRWWRGRQKKFMWRRLRQWFRTGLKHLKVPLIDENLAVGWFPSEAPGNPVQQGNSFIMHALGPECGGLWARVGTACQQTIRGLQNVQMYFFVVLRESGAAYYVASIPGVPETSLYPKMRLLAIDPFQADPTVYAGIHQSALGQIGFRVDTRVYRTQVAAIPEFSGWYGSAHGADAFVGDGSLHLSNAEVGGSWTVHGGDFRRTADGLVSRDAVNTAMLKLNSPSGLIHVLVNTTDEPVEGIALIWRGCDEENFWCFEAGSRQCQLSIKENGNWSRFPATKWHRLAPNGLNSLQVSDDGENIRLYLNGDLVYATSFSDARLKDGASVGVRITGSTNSVSLKRFEAHPLEIPVPDTFDLGKAWFVKGSRVVISDGFEGSPAELAGRATPVGARSWKKEIGQGIIQLTGAGAAKVLGSIANPCPGRTAYTVDWTNPDFADVEVRITPPGTQRGSGEKGRGGLIFCQDDRNYITWTVFVDDWYGTSIAAFFYVDGFEELYDAVWTNVGKRIHWGVPYDFRVVCDGKKFLAFVNGEPVLYRALSDIYPDWEQMAINRVGIVANWEWGNDTGSVFQNFVAKDLA